MTPTDPTRLRQLLASIKGPLAVRPSTTADGLDCDDVIDKGDGNLNVCEGCDEDRAELIAAALNALPSLLATAENPIRVELNDTPTRYRLRVYEGERVTYEREESPPYAVLAEWARKARGVLERATAEYDNAMAHVTNANYDDAGIHGMDLRAALDSILAPVLSETETTAPTEPHVGARIQHRRGLGWAVVVVQDRRGWWCSDGPDYPDDTDRLFLYGPQDWRLEWEAPTGDAGGGDDGR